MTLAHNVSKFFKILGNKTRINILAILYEKNRSVTEIKEIYDERIRKIALSMISIQLSKLYDNKLVKFHKEGRKKIFKIADEHVLHILNDSIIHIKGGVGCKDALESKDKEYSKIMEVIN